MIRVTVELQSAITGETSLLGRMLIWNKGDSTNRARGNYGVSVCRKGDWEAGLGVPATNPTRTGEVLNYPRLSYNIWRLVLRALHSAFPEETA